MVQTAQQLTGPQGPAGNVATVCSMASNGAYCSTPGTSYAFTGPVVSVVITSASQKVMITGTVCLGSTTGTSNSLDISPAYDNGSGLVPFGPGTYGLRAAANSRETYMQTYTITGLAPGTYTFGTAARITVQSDIAKWNSNEYGMVSVLLTQ